MRSLVGVCLAACIAVQPVAAHAQASFLNPTFRVPLTHPPQVVLKGVQKITVREFPGDCGPELSDRLLQQLANTGKFEVIDRANLDSILQEQGFQASMAINAQTAVKLGQLLGPAAMFVGRVSRCSVTVSDPLVVSGRFTDSRGYPATKYARRTTAQMTASIQLIDFSTGKIHSARLIEARAERVNEALNGYPEAPDAELVKTAMFLDAISQAQRIILPWTETVEIVVYDDNDKNKMELKASTEQMKRGDFGRAVESLRAIIAQGGGPKTTDKERQRAKYDLGIALMYSGQLPEALTTLREAADADPRNSTFRGGLAAAERMSSLQSEYRRLEAAAVEFGKAPATPTRPAVPGGQKPAAPPPPTGTKPAVRPPPKGAKPAVGETITNAEILGYVKLKLGDAAILSRIKAPCRFSTTLKDLELLKQAGASTAVIEAIMMAKCGTP